MLLNFFTVPLIFFVIFLLAAQVLLKIKVSVEPCIVSVVALRLEGKNILTTKN